MHKIKFSGVGLYLFVATNIFASPIIPTGNNNNALYYKIGGASDYILSPVQDTRSIQLTAGADLGLGNQCGMYNPAVSIQNTLNHLQDSVNNLEQSLISSATGSIAEMPMYFLAQANPTLYNLLNNALISAHTQLAASVKSCQAVKDQIAQGKNPYQDWGTISIGDMWKQHLSLTASGDEDINDAKESIEQHAGDEGVAWVQGKNSSDNTVRAAGKNQPPIHIIADTVKAGYNTMLNRAFTSDTTAPDNSGLAQQFATPQEAVNWITSVLGDQIVTTCTDTTCTAQQGGVAGRGLLPWVTECNASNHNDCIDTISQKLQQLVSGSIPVTKENLLAVSADNLVISPHILATIKNMEASQQGIVLYKLAQEVALQRLMNKALTAHDILQTGSQIPVIANNQPAQKVLQLALNNLDKNIHSLAFEAQIRKQMMSDTLASLVTYSNVQQQQAENLGSVAPSQPQMNHSAVSISGVTP